MDPLQKGLDSLYPIASLYLDPVSELRIPILVRTIPFTGSECDLTNPHVTLPNEFS